MLLRTRSTPAVGPLPALLGTLAAKARPEHLAVGRAGAGAVMVLRPRALPERLGVDSAAATRMSWAVQMLGAREIALGVGTAVALRRGDVRGARLWVAAGVLSDAVDALAVGAAVARGRLSPLAGGAVTAVALGATALGVQELQRDESDLSTG